MVAQIATPRLQIDAILHGDSLEVLRSLPDACVDAIVTDPPAGIEFMGKEWDTFKQGRLKTYTKQPGGKAKQSKGTGADFGERMGAHPPISQHANRRCRKCNHYQFSGTPCKCDVPQWAIDNSTRETFIASMLAIFEECLRVLKPGGHALVWALPRTSHWTAMALEDAGFEVRDCVTHLFGSGFPKSLDVSKAIDKAAGAKREVVGSAKYRDIRNGHGRGYGDGINAAARQGPEYIEHEFTAPATDAARVWDGWGTALKPAAEFWWLCRKPLAEGTIAGNVLAWGTGALNIGASRVAGKPWTRSTQHRDDLRGGAYGSNKGKRIEWEPQAMPQAGRWPANLLLSHAPDCTAGGCSLWCPIRALDAQSGILHARGNTTPTKRRQSNGSWGMNGATIGIGPDGPIDAGDTGGASRYFTTFRYTAKASRSERNRGCSSLDAVERSNGNKWTDQDYRVARGERTPGRESGPRQNHHPTVKPLALMSWLIGLITPPGGIVLDPFAGSGSTLVAAKEGGWRYLGIEREAEYVAIAEARLSAPSAAPQKPAPKKRTKKQPQPTLLEVSA